VELPDGAGLAPGRRGRLASVPRPGVKGVFLVRSTAEAGLPLVVLPLEDGFTLSLGSFAGGISIECLQIGSG